MDPNKRMKERSGLTILSYVIAAALIIGIIVGVVLLIINNPQQTVMVVLAIIGGIVGIAIVLILLSVVVGIYYGFKGSETQTDMSYSIDDQEHAESFDEAKDAPSSKK